MKNKSNDENGSVNRKPKERKTNKKDSANLSEYIHVTKCKLQPQITYKMKIKNSRKVYRIMLNRKLRKNVQHAKKLVARIVGKKLLQL